MKNIISLLFFLLTFAVNASVIDLGDLSIEGEVRRPLITTIQAPQYTKYLAKISAKRNFDHLVKSTFTSYSSEDFLKKLNSGQLLQEEVSK